MSLGDALLDDYLHNGAATLRAAIAREPDCKIVVYLLRDKIAAEAPLFLAQYEEDFRAELAEPRPVFNGPRVAPV